MPSKECYDHLGNRFDSLSDMCKYWGVNISTYCARIKSGMSIKEALTNEIGTVYEGLNGDTYTTLRDLAKAYGINKSTLKFRIKKGMSIGEALTTNLYNATKTYIGLNDDTYRSLSDLARAYNLNKGLLVNRIKKGMSTQDALRDIMHSLQGKPKAYRGLNNDTYKTVADLARAYNVPYYILECKIKNGMSTQEILTEYFHNVNRAYEGLNNDRYKTLKDLAEAYGVSYALVLKKNKQGMGTQDILIELLDMPYDDTFGNRYKLLKDMASAWNIRSITISARLNAKIEMCVALVAKDAVKLRFVGLDGKARYTLNGNKNKYCTARELVEKYRPDLLEIYDKYNPTGEYKPYNGGQ